VIYQVDLQYAVSGGYLASCPALPGCVAQGRTESEAMANIKEAITAWFWDEDVHIRMALPVAV
jgi:predicted RNase H-like HicB family nuclease